MWVLSHHISPLFPEGSRLPRPSKSLSSNYVEGRGNASNEFPCIFEKQTPPSHPFFPQAPLHLASDVKPLSPPCWTGVRENQTRPPLPSPLLLFHLQPQSCLLLLLRETPSEAPPELHSKKKPRFLFHPLLSSFLPPFLLFRLRLPPPQKFCEARKKGELKQPSHAVVLFSCLSWNERRRRWTRGPGEKETVPPTSAPGGRSPPLFTFLVLFPSLSPHSEVLEKREKRRGEGGPSLLHLSCRLLQQLPLRGGEGERGGNPKALIYSSFASAWRKHRRIRGRWTIDSLIQ